MASEVIRISFTQPTERTVEALSDVPRLAPVKVRVPSRKECVVLVPVGTHIEPACEAGLSELERRGYAVWRVRGYSAIDQGRNQMATDALAQGYAETMWIDSDIAFEADDIDRLRCLDLPLVCGIYPKKGKRELAAHVLRGTSELVFGHAGGLVEVQYAGAGFLHVRREVYEAVQRTCELPECNLEFGKGMIPWFMPMIADPQHGFADVSSRETLKLPDNEAIRLVRVFAQPDESSRAVRMRPWYLAEDYAFCERVRQSGFRIWADTRVRLGHIGAYSYSWEEAGTDIKRFATFTYRLTKS
jgi:hypothetical protein